MSYYRECPICGSNLDPGEQCTCAEDRRKEAERKQKLYQIGAYGQIMSISAGRNRAMRRQSYKACIEVMLLIIISVGCLLAKHTDGKRAGREERDLCQCGGYQRGQEYIPGRGRTTAGTAGHRERGSGASFRSTGILLQQGLGCRGKLSACQNRHGGSGR